MKKIELTCIVCPIGCTIKLIKDKDKIISVSGNGCKRGYDYSIEEITNPKRTLTTTIRIENDLMLSVKSEKAIPKEKILKCMSIINGVKVKTPVKIGDVIIKDILKTGIDIVSTKNIN